MLEHGVSGRTDHAGTSMIQIRELQRFKAERVGFAGADRPRVSLEPRKASVEVLLRLEGFTGSALGFRSVFDTTSGPSVSDYSVCDYCHKRRHFAVSTSAWDARTRGHRHKSWRTAQGRPQIYRPTRTRSAVADRHDLHWPDGGPAERGFRAVV